MLTITTPLVEIFNEYTNEFMTIEPQTLYLEHSLVAISEWESKWEKPFFSNGDEIKKTNEEYMDYIRCMTLNKNVNPLIYSCMPNESLTVIDSYINSGHTATTIHSTETKKRGSEGITSELIYYWMVAFNIPFEAQTWHINRLLMLIEICNIKNQPEKKMSRKAQMQQQRALNEARRKRYNSSG